MKKRFLSLLVSVAMIAASLPQAAYGSQVTSGKQPAYGSQVTYGKQPAYSNQSTAEALAKFDTTDKAAPAKSTGIKRTILFYACGSNLETDFGLATFNIHQVLRANFSADDEVKFIILTGGAKKWQMESQYLVDPNNPDGDDVTISNEYNQIWEAKGADAPENAGKLVLLDRDGLTGDGDEALPSKHELMTDLDTLKMFINYGVENFPADKYDLILWDHGGGPTDGFGVDQLYEKGVSLGRDNMSFSNIVEAIKDNDLIKSGKKFDFVDFDACLMNSIEYNLALSDYVDYYIASPELEPGYGQNYEGWMNLAGENPDIDTFELGKKMVDDIISFYTDAASPGYGEDATLAVVDLKKLMETTFTRDMKGIVEIMSDEAKMPTFSDIMFGQLLFYDELRSVKDSIMYGGGYCSYFDIGTLLAQLCVRIDELDEGDVSDETVMDITSYSYAAKRIMAILDNKDIIYARGTENIKTKDVFYRDSEGEYKYGSLGTSGMFIFFPMVEYPDEAYYCYIDKMKAVMDQISPDNTDILDFFDEHISTVCYYSLLSTCGGTVNDLIESGADKDMIDYDLVKSVWLGENDDYYSNYSECWDEFIKEYIDILGGEGVVSIWLQTLIYQQAAEAIDYDNIEVNPILTPNGTGYKVDISDTRQRVVESVDQKIYAELPGLEKYIESDSFLSKYSYFLFTELNIGSISGERKIDIDYSITDETELLKDYIKKKNGTSSTWRVDPVENKWYAVKDSSGTLHVAAAEDVGAGIIQLPILFELKNDDQDVTLDMDSRFGYLEFHNSELTKLYIKDGSVYRPFTPSELEDDINLEMVTSVTGTLLFYDVDLPISETTFTLNAANADSITLEYLPIDEISDIKDTDGDGKSFYSSLIIKDIYGAEFDISGSSLNPEDELTDISFAWAKPGLYSGEELNPEIICLGKTLTKGEDYELYKVNPNEEFIENGTYSVILKGIGKYTGTTEIEFKIVDPDKESAAMIEILNNYVEIARQDFFNLLNEGDAESIKEAANVLTTMQNMLAQAQETINNAANQKIKDLEASINSMNDKLAELSVVDISNYGVVLESDSFEYTGSPITPKVTVSGLTPKDYTVEYSENEKIGTAKIVITGNKENNYKGVITKTFKITKKANTLSLKGKTVKVKKAKNKSKKISYKKALTIKNAKGSLTYTKISGSKKIKINKKTGRITLGKGLKKGTYKVKIKVYASGDDTYKSITKKTIIKIKVRY